MDKTVVIIGLGYVGLPLAVALSKKQKVIGFDINLERIQELKGGFDRTEEVESEKLSKANIEYSSNVEDLNDAHIYIITVPTPLDAKNNPDLTPLKKASEMLASVIKKGDIIVYESTVYPGVTEDFCGPILEAKSGLKAGEDFYLGYSPERINPGDKVHTVETITKIVSAQNTETLKELVALYGQVNNHKIFSATSIKVAEAAKVIENAQRDINIAFINEITAIFNKMDISIYDVLEAAQTKWNFLPFTPGLVGGHCIGIDPYYLATAAKAVGHDPRIILAGRDTNEGMAIFMASLINKNINKKNAKLLILGVSFKENVPDYRNTKIVDLIQALKPYGYDITIYDPVVDKDGLKAEYGLDVITNVDDLQEYDAMVLAVPHTQFTKEGKANICHHLLPGGRIFDLKGIWRKETWPSDISYISL